MMGAALLPLSISATLGACKQNADDDEDTKPLPTVTMAPAPTPAPTPTVSATSEDAGTPPSDAPSDAVPAKVAGDPTGLRRCCKDLRQNVKTSPPQFQAAYLLAASACDGMVKGGGKEIAHLRGMLLGAGLPATCK